MGRAKTPSTLKQRGLARPMSLRLSKSLLNRVLSLVQGNCTTGFSREQSAFMVSSSIEKIVILA